MDYIEYYDTDTTSSAYHGTVDGCCDHYDYIIVHNYIDEPCHDAEIAYNEKIRFPLFVQEKIKQIFVDSHEKPRPEV